MEPAVERDLLPLVLGDVGDVDGREHAAGLRAIVRSEGAEGI